MTYYKLKESNDTLLLENTLISRNSAYKHVGLSVDQLKLIPLETYDLLLWFPMKEVQIIDMIIGENMAAWVVCNKDEL